MSDAGPAEPGKRRPINTNEIRKHAPATKADPEHEHELEPEPEPDGCDEEVKASLVAEETMLARVAALTVQQLLNQKVAFIQERLVWHVLQSAKPLAYGSHPILA